MREPRGSHPHPCAFLVFWKDLVPYLLTPGDTTPNKAPVLQVLHSHQPRGLGLSEPVPSNTAHSTVH